MAHHRLLDQLEWLAGTWTARGKDWSMEEHWLLPDAGSMVGINRTVRAGATVSVEVLLVEVAGPTLHLLVDLPLSGRKEHMALDSLGQGWVAWEHREGKNERLTYRQAHDGHLEVTLEKGAGADHRHTEFRLERVPAAGDADRGHHR